MKMHVTIDMISHITGLPKAGVDPSQYFREKDNDKRLASKLKNKYDIVWDKQEYVINTINDREVPIIAKLLAIKIVRINKLSQCMSVVIACAEQCVEGF